MQAQGNALGIRNNVAHSPKGAALSRPVICVDPVPLASFYCDRWDSGFRVGRETKATGKTDRGMVGNCLVPPLWGFVYLPPFPKGVALG